MATAALQPDTRPANTVAPSARRLTLIRAAHAERIEAAADKAKREPIAFEGAAAGMPSKLFAAGCYLASFGMAIEPTDAERFFGIDGTTYADMASNEAVGASLIADGERALFGRFHPIVSAELAAELDRTDAMSAAWDAMHAAASDFRSNRYEQAKASFVALAKEAARG